MPFRYSRGGREAEAQGVISAGDKSVGVLSTEMAISSLGGGRSGRQRECGEEV